MIVLEEKFNRKTPNSWLCYAKSLKFSSKKASALTNGNLYHYAGNNPVRYIDPDGRISIIHSAPRRMQSFASTIPNSNTTFAQAGCTFTEMTAIIDDFRNRNNMDSIN